MTITVVLLHLARLLAPAAARERRFEERQADIAGCSEVGLSAASIALGALMMEAGARAGLISAAVARAAHTSSAALIGVLIGAVCAIGDLSVLAVFLSAALIHAAVTVVTGWRNHAAQPRRSRIEPSR